MICDGTFSSNRMFYRVDFGLFHLTEPNNESPLNCYAATLWSNQEGLYVFSILDSLLLFLSVFSALHYIQHNQTCEGNAF